MMTRILNYFFKGLVFLAPLAFTIYVIVRVFSTIDGWLGLKIPGIGFLVTVALITAFGFFAQSFLTRGALGLVEKLFERLPFVRILYTSARDLLNAFVGEQRRFDKPVIVSPYPGGVARVFGFVTQESLDSIGLPGHVTVYLPFSYSIAGTLMVVPTSAVTPFDADSADAMAFIVSGGVTGLPTVPKAAAGQQ
jgi:uncharacterized membrane protein